MSRKRDSSAEKQSISRRDFTRCVTLATAAMAALPSDILHASAAAQPAALPQPDEPKLSAESQAEVDAKVQAIFRKYGGRLSDEEKKDIRRLVTEGQKPLETLRAYKLENSDQPATILRLYPDLPYPHRHSSKPAGAARPAQKE